MALTRTAGTLIEAARSRRTSRSVSACGSAAGRVTATNVVRAGSVNSSRSRRSPCDRRSRTSPRLADSDDGLILEQDGHQRFDPVVSEPRHLEQPQRMPGGRAVDHHEIEVRLTPGGENRVRDFDHGDQLVDSWRGQVEQILQHLPIVSARRAADA